MRKLSLLVGTLGGALAGYIVSNKKLRDQLSNAKDAEAAAMLLGKHLQKDGHKLAKQVREFVESDEVQNNLSKAKKFASAKLQEAKSELNDLVSEGAEKASKAVKKGSANAFKSARRLKTKTRKVS